MKRTFCMAVLIALLLMAGTAFALDNTTIDVSATVMAGCTIQSGAPMTLAFGSVDPTTFTDTTLSGQLVFRCTNGVNYTVTLDGVQEPSGVGIARNMTDGGANSLAYTLTPQSSPTGVSAGSTVDITYDVDATLTSAEVVTNGVGGITYGDSIAVLITP